MRSSHRQEGGPLAALASGPGPEARLRHPLGRKLSMVPVTPALALVPNVAFSMASAVKWPPLPVPSSGLLMASLPGFAWRNHPTLPARKRAIARKLKSDSISGCSERVAQCDECSEEGPDAAVAFRELGGVEARDEARIARWVGDAGERSAPGPFQRRDRSFGMFHGHVAVCERAVWLERRSRRGAARSRRQRTERRAPRRRGRRRNARGASRDRRRSRRTRSTCRPRSPR